jgi:hypothetical protein
MLRSIVYQLNFMATRNSTQATPPCHIRKIKVAYTVYDYSVKPIGANHCTLVATQGALAGKGRFHD